MRKEPYKIKARKYQSRETFEAVIMASHVEQARIIVGRDFQGATLLTAKPLKGNEVAFLDKVFKGDSDTWLQNTFRQLSNLYSAGIPLAECLSILQGCEEITYLKKILAGIQARVLEGNALSTCLKKAKVFPSLCHLMIEASEMTGNLDQGFSTLSKYYQKQRVTKKKIGSALLSHKINLLLALGGVIVAGIWILPDYARVMERVNMEVPFAMMMLTTVFTFLRDNWVLSLGWVGLCKFSFDIWKAKHPDRYKKLVYKLPVIGELEFKTTCMMFCNSLALLIEAGVPIQTAVKLSAQATNCAHFIDRLKLMETKVLQGHSIANSARATNLFPPLIEGMMVSGEASGRMGQMLWSVVETYQIDVEEGVESIAEKLQPIMGIFLGAIGVFLAYSIVLPQLDIIIGMGAM